MKSRHSSYKATPDENKIRNAVREYLMMPIDKNNKQETEIEKYIKEKIRTLTAEKFIKCFQQGSDDYANRPTKLGDKSYSPDAFFRSLKAYMRAPSAVTDDNVKQKLQEFIAAPIGGRDALSLKYSVIEALLFTAPTGHVFYDVQTPEDSAKIIDLVTKILGPGDGFELNDTKIHPL